MHLTLDKAKFLFNFFCSYRDSVTNRSRFGGKLHILVCKKLPICLIVALSFTTNYIRKSISKNYIRLEEGGWVGYRGCVLVGAFSL